MRELRHPAKQRANTAVLIELGDGSARSIGMEPTCSKTHRDRDRLKSSCFDI